MADGTVRNWPEALHERRIGHAAMPPSAWQESAPDCWTAANHLRGETYFAVVDDASGLAVTMVHGPGQPRELPPAAWFRLADALGTMLADAGWRVTCGAEGCEHRRWPCPKRVAYAITTPIGPPAGSTADAERHRPVSNGKLTT